MADGLRNSLELQISDELKNLAKRGVYTLLKLWQGQALKEIYASYRGQLRIGAESCAN